MATSQELNAVRDNNCIYAQPKVITLKSSPYTRLDQTKIRTHVPQFVGGDMCTCVGLSHIQVERNLLGI